MNGSEHKRSARRIPRRIKVEFEVGVGNKKHVGFTSNLSATGMFLGTNSPYKEGTRVKVRLLLDEPLEVETIVVHSKRGVAGAVGVVQSGMGLRLVSPEPKLDALLGLTSSVRDPASRTPTAGKLLVEDSETKAVAEPPLAPPGQSRNSPPEASNLAPESRSLTAELDTRLAEAERSRLRLEEMVEMDEREMRMLRQLVSKVEKARDGLAAELAAGVDELAAETQKARELRTKLQAATTEAAGLRSRVADLEIALRSDRDAASSEPPRQESAGGLRRLNPWTTLIAGAALGALAVWLSGFPGVPSDGAADGPPEAARGIAKTEVEGTTTEVSQQAAGPADASLIASGGAVAGEDIAIGAAAGNESPARPDLSEHEVKEEAETPVTAQVDPLTAAVERVRTWAAAWSEQQVAEYLSSYASSFEPPGGLTLGEWRDQRRDRLSSPQWIRVELGPIEATLSSEDRVTLTFEQSYETPTYSDRVRKTLELVREEGTWKIDAEVLKSDDSA